MGFACKIPRVLWKPWIRALDTLEGALQLVVVFPLGTGGRVCALAYVCVSCCLLTFMLTRGNLSVRLVSSNCPAVDWV